MNLLQTVKITELMNKFNVVSISDSKPWAPASFVEIETSCGRYIMVWASGKTWPVDALAPCKS